MFASPIFAVVVGFFETDSSRITHGSQWILKYMIMAAGHGILFLPLLTGIFAAFVCHYEHADGGWKQLLALPVSRFNVYVVKFLSVMLMLAVTQFLVLVSLLLIGWIKGVPGEFPWIFILQSLFSGWLACAPLAALQLAVSVSWTSFAAPLAVNVIFVIPNILVINSKYAPFYPWAQPVLSMFGNEKEAFGGAINSSLFTLVVVILGSFIIFFLSGLVYFQKKNM
jgi:hypothetical protein